MQNRGSDPLKNAKEFEFELFIFGVNTKSICSLSELNWARKGTESSFKSTDNVNTKETKVAFLLVHLMTELYED